MLHIPQSALITVAGTVGIGKSTLTNALAESLNFDTSFEKVDGNPYLEKFYQDFERWSFHLQVYFLAERFKEQKKIFDAGGGFVQDRSIYEDTGIFARMHYDKGTMSHTDFETYTSLFEAMVMTPYFPKPDVVLFLDAPLGQVLERVAARGREMEKKTSISYWRELHGRYEEWIDSFNACPVIKLDVNQYDLIEDPSSISYVIDKLDTFFASR